MNNSEKHLIAVDASDFSEGAFHWAVNSTPKKDIFIIAHGYEHGVFKLPGYIKQEEMKEFTEAKEIMTKYKKLCEINNRQCIFEEFPYSNVTELSDKICDTAHKYRASSIVMGSRGLSGINKLFMGSVSQTVVNNCDCAATIIWKKTSSPSPSSSSSSSSSSSATITSTS